MNTAEEKAVRSAGWFGTLGYADPDKFDISRPPIDQLEHL